jgi:SAM-dependent methyltransferase
MTLEQRIRNAEATVLGSSTANAARSSSKPISPLSGANHDEIPQDRAPGRRPPGPAGWSTRASVICWVMSGERYAFGEDRTFEEQRLAALERAVDAHSRNALIEVGLGAGWRCWEVGAGRGSIARWLSAVAGAEGRVLATDLDDRWFDAGGRDIVFRRHDVLRDPVPEDGFDLIHARFLLEHLAGPRAVIARLAEALRPGGVLVLADSAGLELNVTPSTPVFDDFAPAWERAGAAVGWNASYGNELMRDLGRSGLIELQGRQYRLLAPGGESWAHIARGIQRLETELNAEGITAERLNAVRRCLTDPANLITGPPVTIAWGRREDDGGGHPSRSVV